jgi:hypothetical protein
MWTRFKPRWGYGTWFMLAVAVLLWWSGVLKPSQPATDMRVVYEADGTGRLRRVAPSPAHLPARLPVLEPRLLLQHAHLLQLTPAQRARIERIVRDWEQEQKRWLSAIRQQQERVDDEWRSHGNRAIPYSVLRGSLQHYSELSRAYGAARAAAWGRATAELSTRQKRQLERVIASR